MKIAIAAEVTSLDIMLFIKEYLLQNNYEVMDVGMRSRDDPKYFYETPPLVAKAILNGGAERGILMCGTGMGVCIAANKIKGIYAAVAETSTTARLHYIINRANVLCLGAWIVGFRAVELVDAYLNAKIGDGMGEERKRVQDKGFERIKAIEAENFMS